MTAMTISREVPEKVEDRLIVALDVPAISEARAVIDKLEGVVSFFKVGLWLQFAAGLRRPARSSARKEQEHFSGIM